MNDSEDITKWTDEGLVNALAASWPPDKTRLQHRVVEEIKRRAYSEGWVAARAEFEQGRE